jgi:hypothetical protein
VSGRESYTSMGVYFGEDAHVRCSTYPDHGPILSLVAGPASLSLSIAGQADMPRWGVEFARALVREAQRFAAECERVGAAQQAQVTSSSAADDAA